MRRALAIVGVLVFLLSLSSCLVGPNYKRPSVAAPPSYRGATPDVAGSESAASLGDEKWWNVFQDEELQKLVRTGLTQNFDVRIAATKIMQAYEQVRITRANGLPSVSAGPGFTGVRSPSIPGIFPGYSYLADSLTASVSWNVDFWGRYRRATEAARANLLQADWNRRAVIATFVENLATAYFQLRALDSELDIAKQTLASRQQSLQLTETLERGGATSMVDVRQAQQLVEEAAEVIPDDERQIAQTEDEISILIGENPHNIPRGRKLEDQPLPQTVPPGIPSQLLERRPDIQEAEQQLVAANADIGVARAQLFPQISLTGQAGLESIGLGNLFVGTNRVWSFTSSLTQPIFEGGSLRANVRLAESQKQQYVLTYQQTIQTAFREVSDSLVAYGKYRDYRVHQEALTTAAREAANLSEIRYRGGVTSYLEVLTNETTYFSAELNLAQARLNERLSLVQLYNALGGGWQQS